MLRACVRHPFRGLAVVIVALFSAIALSVRFQLQGPLGWVRRLNRVGVNRLTRARAGRPGSPFVLVYHKGRRSGGSYRTPVIAAGSGQHLYIALTYGPETDWCRNVIAAGGGRILRDGGEYAIGEPEVTGAAAALPAFSLLVRIACRIIGIKQFLRVAVGEPVFPSPGGEGEGEAPAE